VRERAASLAAEAGVTIEHVAKPHTRKEEVVARVLEQHGDHPGLVHIISAMEDYDAYTETSPMDGRRSPGGTRRGASDPRSGTWWSWVSLLPGFSRRLGLRRPRK